MGGPPHHPSCVPRRAGFTPPTGAPAPRRGIKAEGRRASEVAPPRGVALAGSATPPQVAAMCHDKPHPLGWISAPARDITGAAPRTPHPANRPNHPPCQTAPTSYRRNTDVPPTQKFPTKQGRSRPRASGLKKPPFAPLTRRAGVTPPPPDLTARAWPSPSGSPPPGSPCRPWPS
jgi:hypothetical protein